MDRSQLHLEKNYLSQLQTNGVGYDVLRFICLPDLLGREAPYLLYIMGKNLARKITLHSMEEVTEYCSLFGWGELKVTKEKRNALIMELTSETVARRREARLDNSGYRLEAGFLAECVEKIKGISCECLEDTKPENSKVQFDIIYTKL